MNLLCFGGGGHLGSKKEDGLRLKECGEGILKSIIPKHIGLLQGKEWFTFVTQ